ncbi:MAG TPA: hypothetical protein VGA33_10990, partial [Thermoanaerobaculia bacterium]
PEYPGRRDFSGDAPDVGADPHIARRTGGKTVCFSIPRRQNRTFLSRSSAGRHQPMYVSIG